MFWSDMGKNIVRTVVLTVVGGLVTKAMNGGISLPSFSSNEKPYTPPTPSKSEVVTPTQTSAQTAWARGGIVADYMSAGVAIDEGIDRGYSQRYASDFSELQTELERLEDTGNVTVEYENQGGDILAKIFIDGELDKTVPLES